MINLLMEQKSNRIISFCIIMALIFSMFVPLQSYGVEATVNKPINIEVYVRPDITIKYNDNEMIFFDVKGTRVYPISYNGTTYLPIRAVSSLSDKPIEWDNASKSVYMGRTFTDPAGATKGNTSSAIALENLSKNLKADASSSFYRGQAKLRPDIYFVYNFTFKKFKDANDKEIYPIIYRGSTYLPIRNVSELVNYSIDWEPVTKTISIINPRTYIPAPTTTNEAITVSESAITNSAITKSAITDMQAIFQREKEVYNDVSAKIVEIVKLKDKVAKENIAKSISEDYTVITKLIKLLNEIDLKSLPEDEILIHEKLMEFSQSVEMYVLVMENIAYMDLNDQDYSLLADTLLYYALDTQSKMDYVKL